MQKHNCPENAPHIYSVVSQGFFPFLFLAYLCHLETTQDVDYAAVTKNLPSLCRLA